jgi:hypothetical protein
MGAIPGIARVQGRTPVTVNRLPEPPTSLSWLLRSDYANSCIAENDGVTEISDWRVVGM